MRDKRIVTRGRAEQERQVGAGAGTARGSSLERESVFIRSFSSLYLEYVFFSPLFGLVS